MICIIPKYMVDLVECQDLFCLEKVPIDLVHPDLHLTSFIEKIIESLHFIHKNVQAEKILFAHRLKHLFN